MVYMVPAVHVGGGWLLAKGVGFFTMEGMSATCTAGEPSMSAVSVTATACSRMVQQDAALEHH
jgi:hypothetical protein